MPATLQYLRYHRHRFLQSHHRDRLVQHHSSELTRVTPLLTFQFKADDQSHPSPRWNCSRWVQEYLIKLPPAPVVRNHHENEDARPKQKLKRKQKRLRLLAPIRAVTRLQQNPATVRDLRLQLPCRLQGHQRRLQSLHDSSKVRA